MTRADGRPHQAFGGAASVLVTMTVVSCLLLAGGAWKMLPPRLRRNRPSYRRQPVLRHSTRRSPPRPRRLFLQSRQQQQQRQQGSAARRLTACELCGFVSRRRPVVQRHRRLCDAGGTDRTTRSLSCDRCDWTGSTVTMYVEHRHAAHGDHITVYRCVSLTHTHTLSLSYSFLVLVR